MSPEQISEHMIQLLEEATCEDDIHDVEFMVNLLSMPKSTSKFCITDYSVNDFKSWSLGLGSFWKDCLKEYWALRNR